MTAAEETRQTMTKKQQSTNERRQRKRTTTAGERRGAVVEAEEQLLYGSRGETAPWRMEQRYVEDGRGGVGQGVRFFLFLATFNPTLYNPTK